MLFRLPSEEELTDNKLNEFIAKHDAECAFRFKHLKNAYETDYQIFHQKPKPDYKPDNRIAVNFAKYMVDTFNGYFIGNPIRISVDNDTNDNIKKYVELLDQYNDQDDNNAELSKICCIYGKGYEMYYVDKLGNIGITYLTPFDAFMIYDDSVLCRELYFVRLYTDSNDVLHGSVSDDTKVRWFTQKGKLVWEKEEIYFQKLTHGEYDPATGNYGEDTISEDMKSASVMDTGTNTMMLVYSGIKEDSLTIHLQNHYDRPFDRIRVGNKAYGVDFSRKLRTKQVYVVSEVV